MQSYKGIKVGDRVRRIGVKGDAGLGTVSDIRAGKKMVSGKTADYGIAWDARNGHVFAANRADIEVVS